MSSKRGRLVSANDVLVPAVLALRELGFEVAVYRDRPSETFVASRSDVELQAEDPITLLGLAQLWALRGPDWRASDDQIARFVQRYEAPESVIALD